MNMTIFNIKQSQVAGKLRSHPSWPPKHIQLLDYQKTKTTIVNTYYYYSDEYKNKKKKKTKDVCLQNCVLFADDS